MSDEKNIERGNKTEFASAPEHFYERIDNFLAGVKKLTDPRAYHPWVLSMAWKDLLFASWRLPIHVVRAKVPPELELDTFDGSAWVTMVPMHITDIHFRGVPAIPGMESLRELNLRTYVKLNGKAGVYFLSIECPAVLSDWMAVHFFGVPYLKAQIAIAKDGDSHHYASERAHELHPPAAFFGTFQPAGETFNPTAGSLEAFLVERFCLFYVKDGKVHRGDILHDTWKLQNANLKIELNTIGKSAGLELSEKPDHIVFSSSTNTYIWLPVQEDRANTAEN